MTSIYDVTNNAHKIQMTPCATEWTPREKFLRTPLVKDQYQINLGVSRILVVCNLFCIATPYNPTRPI